MFFKNHSIEVTFRYFYIVFDYSWFLELKLNRYKLLIFLRLFIHQVLLFGFLVIIFVSLIVDLFICIDRISVHWYQKLSLGVIWKFSVGRIQIGHTDFLPPQVCGRSWQGCLLGVLTCLLQLIAFIDLKYPSSSSLKHYFVDFWPVCIIFIGSEFIDTETCPRVWLKIFIGPYPNRTHGFSSPKGLWKVVARVPVFVISTVTINTFIGFKAVPQVIQVWSCVMWKSCG